MRYSIAILAFAAAVLASPTGTPPPSGTPSCPGGGSGSPGGGSPGGGSGSPGGGSGTPAPVCTGAVYSQAQCCATDVLGAVGLNCAVRKCLKPPIFELTSDKHLQPPLLLQAPMSSSRLVPRRASKLNVASFLSPVRISCARMLALLASRLRRLTRLGNPGRMVLLGFGRFSKLGIITAAEPLWISGCTYTRI